MYQLKTRVEVNDLDWNKLSAPEGDLDVMAPFLSTTDHPQLARRTERFQRAEMETVKLRRIRGTRYLLFVTVGRDRSNHSMLLMRTFPPWRAREVYLHRYDVFPGTVEDHQFAQEERSTAP